MASSKKSTASRPSAGTPAPATTPITSSSCATTPAASPASPASAFISALRAENIPVGPLYPYPLYHQPPLVEPFSRITPCPNSELLCQQTISISQNILLAAPHEMDDILQAILKVRQNIAALH